VRSRSDLSLTVCAQLDSADLEDQNSISLSVSPVFQFCQFFAIQNVPPEPSLVRQSFWKDNIPLAVLDISQPLLALLPFTHILAHTLYDESALIFHQSRG